MTGACKGRSAAFICLGILWTAPSLAQGSDCSSFGNEIEQLGSDNIALGRINDLSPRVSFVKRGSVQKGCPNTRAACRDKAYLVPEDEVVVMGNHDEFVCAGYANKRGQVTEGWLPLAAIHLERKSAEVRSSDWIGTWRSGPEQEVTININPSSDRLKISGNATWGASDPEQAERGAINTGELEGDVKAHGALLSFGMGESRTLPFEEADETDCKVQMQRLGSYLLVKDNNMCGGMNVTFTGIYRRVK